MKRLILVRHAEAAPAGSQQTDHDRPLSDLGITEAGKLAHHLKKKGHVPDRMLVSSANRTQTTAQMLMTAFGQDNVDVEVRQELYLADASGLWESILNTDDGFDSLMIVAHNPGLSDLAHLLDKEVAGLKTAQSLRVKFDIEHWVDADVRKVVKTRLK